MSEPQLETFASIILKHWCSTWCALCISEIATELNRQGFRDEAQRLNDLTFARRWIASTLTSFGDATPADPDRRGE